MSSLKTDRESRLARALEEIQQTMPSDGSGCENGAFDRLQRLIKAYEAGQAISASLEFDVVAGQAATQAVEILEATAAALAWVDGESGQLVFRASEGPVAGVFLARRPVAGEGIAGTVLKTGRGLLVHDLPQDEKWADAPDADPGFPVRSLLCVPLLGPDHPLGALEVWSGADDAPFSSQDLELLSTFAAQVAVALENARAHAETRRQLAQAEAQLAETERVLTRRHRELATIEEIDHELGTNLDYDRIIDLVLKRAIEACNASSGMIGTLSDDGERLEARFSGPSGADQKAVTGTRAWPVDRGIVGRVVRSGEPTRIDDVRTDPDYEAVSETTRSEVAVPIKRRGTGEGTEQVIGVLNLESDRPAAFTPDDLHFMEHLADHVGIALENARLFREEQRRAANLATLNEVSATVSSVLDSEQVLTTILDSVIEVSNCQKAAIFVLEEDRVSLRVSHGLSDEYVAGAQDVEVTPDSRARATLAKEPLVVSDIEDEPELADFLPLARREGFRALADLPLRGREANLGTLTVYFAEPHSFSSVELDTLKTFANQAAIAMENARIFEEERQRVRMLRTIGEIGREIRTSLDLERTLNLILARVKDLVDYYIAEICLWDETDQVMITHASAGDPRYTAASGGIYHLDEGYTGWIARHQEHLLIADIPVRHDVRPKMEAEATPLRSYLGLPLKTGDELVGTLEIASDELDAYNADDLAILQIIADQAAVAIQNARLYQETEQQFEQTQLLLRVSEAIGSTLDLTETVRQVARQMCRALDADMAGVYLPDETGTRLRAVAGYHIPKDKLELYRDFRVPIEGHPFIEEAWQTHQAVYSLDPTHDPRLDPATLEAFPNETTLFAPMVARDQVIGGVYLVWSTEKREFSQEELQVANAIAWQAGTVVDNARLFEAQQERLRELGILFETSAAISSSLALDEVLQTVARQMARALNVSTCSISDWDPERGLVTTLVHEDVIPGLPPSDVGVAYPLDDYPATAEALKRRQPVVIQVDDPDADEAEVALLKEMQQKSLMMMPLIARDNVVGLLELYESRHVREFSEADVRLGQALANQAAVAIENARLYEQTDERLRARLEELTALQHTIEELNATLALDHILQVVLESAVQTTGATHGNLMLTDRETGELSLRTSQGYSPEEQADIEALLLDASGDSLTLQVSRSGEARIVDDARRETCSVCVRQDTRSALVVPIFYEQVVVGLINLRHTDVEAFDQDDLTFVQSLAEQAAIAIGNALRYEDQIRANTRLRHRTEQMGRLLEISQKLRADVPLGEALEEIAYAIQETVGFNVVLISVVENWQSTRPTLRRMAAAGLTLRAFEQLQKVRQPVARYEKILREEYRQGLCYFFPFQKREDWAAKLHTHAPMVGRGDWQEGQWHANDMLLAPLRGSGGRLLGIISVDDPRDDRRPSRQTLEALAIFANQAAIAAENTQLYSDAQTRADNLARINEVGRSLTQVLDPDHVRNTAVRAVSEMLQCDLSAVFQPDPVHGLFVAVASQGPSPDELADLRFGLGEGLVGHVAATGSPLLVPDASREPRFVEGPSPIGSMICVPMMAGRQVIGVLTAGSTETHAFSQSDEVLLSTLADQAAVVLESARLFAGTQQAAVQLSLLNVIGRRAAAQLELQEMLETTVNALHQNLGYFRVAVLLVDEKSGELAVAAANESFWDVIPSNYRQAPGQGLIGTAAAEGETVLVNDTRTDERYYRTGAWDAPASLSVPIRIAERVAGVLHAEADHAGAFTEEDAASLEIAADQLAVAIQNASLFEETQRRVAELATINEIGRAISSALDAEQLAEMIYTQVGKLLDTRNFHIALYDAEAQTIDVEYLVENSQRQPKVQLELGQGLTSYLISTGEPILLTHGTTEFLREHDLTLERDPAKSWLGVPMIAEDRAIGAIAVQSFDQENAFDEGHLNLLATVAGQAAIAFQNVSLFEERQRRINELSVLNEMGQTISSSLELKDLLETIHQQVNRIFDTTNFYIATYQEGQEEWTLAFAQEHGEREPVARYSVKAGLTGYILRTREPILLRSLDEVVAFHEKYGIGQVGERARSWMGVPLVAADRIVGVMAIQDYTRDRVYDEQDLALFSTLAAGTAAAVRNAQLYRQIVDFSNELEDRVEARTRDLEQALEELTLERDRVETLYRITSELGTTLELERVLERALQLFADALGVTHGTIMLLDQESRFLELRATLNPVEVAVHWNKDEMPPEVIEIAVGERTPLKAGVGLAGWTVEHREPVLVPNIAEESRWLKIPGRELEIHSALAAPLSLGGGDILGVLTLGHPSIGFFTEEHLKLVTAAASQIAMAVNNSDLYAFITDQADQLGSMLQSQQEEAAKNQAVLESIADGVLVIDHNGRVLLVNPAAEELLGISAKALEGDHFRYMLGLGETPAQRELAQGLYSELRHRLEDPTSRDRLFETSTVRLEAGKRALAVNLAPLITAIGGAPGVVAALRDISREVEIERLKNEFISTVSHELRTPMTSIKGYTDLLFLGMAGGLSDSQRNFLQIIKANADRLTALVNDILDISRIETGRIRLNIEALDLREIISQVELAFQEQYREKYITLECHVPKGLPEVRGDKDRVTQVLNNLIANAWQYTLEGGRVTVSATELDGFVRIDVADTGIGIAEDDAARIFDRFYRVDDPVVEEAGGTGLGLSIVKMFVDMLGGQIWVESEVDVGSTFSFTLPLATADAPDVDPDLLSPEATTVISRRPKILVVEDDRDLALLLRRQLEFEGYQVLLAGSGEDAIWLAREEQPQLITLDIMLPDIDGFVVLEKLKAHPLTSPIPVVIASAVLTEKDKGYALGAVDYVVKPFAEEKLLESIEQALRPHDDDAPRHLLVVDDDPDIRGFLEEALSFHGYHIRTAKNGREALDQVAESHPDLILLDLRMPGIDGYEVIRRLKSDEATLFIPIIVITASPVDKERDRVRVLGMGADQYVTKPLSIEGLVDEIKSAISER